MLLYIYLQYLFTKFSYNMKYIILMLFILNIYTCLCDNICKNNNFENINPNLVIYFKNEYGANWKTALEHHIYQKGVKNDKKAA